ncbi:hypothetical protein [Uliginosibacterium sp. H1]|uniref:hypothetical protein n=1 Tax=Uliginosibacterium sp. H1 TaxID=3114757 RepID=UPI002E17DF5D|nr:hypothetical protein [Uliginosibacterium sp. H1]
MNMQTIRHGKGLVAAFFLTIAALLTGCGSSGDADPAGVLQDSITITELTATDTGRVGDEYSFNVKVAVTGGIPANQITYTWEQTQGTAVVVTQTNGDYQSNIKFRPLVPGDITFRVVARTQSGKTSNQAKTVTVNPAVVSSM